MVIELGCQDLDWMTTSFVNFSTSSVPTLKTPANDQSPRREEDLGQWTVLLLRVIGRSMEVGDPSVYPQRPSEAADPLNLKLLRHMTAY